MKKFEATIIIDAPVDRVFEFLANLENATLWQFGVVKSVKVSDAPIGNESKFRQTVWMMGETFDRICEIKADERKNEIVLWTTASKIFHYEAEYRLEPMSPGTILHFSGGMKLRGWRKFLPWLSELDEDYFSIELQRIKNVVGSGIG